MLRRLCFITAAAIAFLMLVCDRSETQTSGKQTDLGKANQLIQQLQRTIKDKDQTISKLENAKKTPAEKALQAKLDKANQALKDKDQQIASLQQNGDLSKDNDRLRKMIRDLEAIKKAPYVHSMALKLRKTDDDGEQVDLVSAVASKTLAKISGIRAIWIGKGADTGVPLSSDNGYQLGVVVLFDDLDSLQKFSTDSLFKQFKDKLADYWEAPVVLDIVRDTESAKKDEAKK